MPLPPFSPLVAALPETVPFVGPEALERRSGITIRARLGANESGFGPSPRVIAALSEAGADAWRYPDPENHDLRYALGAHLGIPAHAVMPGEGIDGLLSLAVRLFIAPGDVVVTSLGAYPTFNYHVTGFGGVLQFVPYAGHHEDLDQLAAEVRRSKARMVYLANPDNPMGSHWPAPAIAAFIASVPEGCIILLDEAYGETAPDGTLPAIDLDQPNLIRFRTFSKAYGLAGMRLGYAFGHPTLIGGFNRVRNHFGITRPGQAAAIAALGDRPYLESAIAAIGRSRESIAAIARANGLEALPSATNFVTIDCGGDGDFAARVLAELAQRAVFIRKPMAPGLDRHIRVSAAPDAELELFADALPQALRAAYEPG
ncbi:pyridoxal phosphate-dependent aminotransferase [Devosia chinhatensis]|uniref:pyridoxal phosphate-dependent aminotransferase n=1 Tax=Devosia chinhatensis TaxID=429727 RepID=UPI001FCDC21C|nr:pyridoxal phosphate-dependent aminotransferase [Devosia chinhatensis]